MRAREFQPLQEINLSAEQDLFPDGVPLDKIEVDPSQTRPVNQQLAAFQDLSAPDIIPVDDYAGEYVPFYSASGFVERDTGRAVAVIMYDDSSVNFPGDPQDVRLIAVDPRYRGQGLSRVLYRQLRARHTLVADDSQSPAGARLWVNMAAAGIPVQGWIQFNSNRTPQELDAEGGREYVRSLELMGAEPAPVSGRFPTYVFPVSPQKGVMDTAVRTPENIHVYRRGYINHYDIGLVAWRG